MHSLAERPNLCFSHEDWLAQFNSNLFGAINLTRSFLPHFRTKKAGTIVFIGSAAAWVGLPALSLYAASKHALTGMTHL